MSFQDYSNSLVARLHLGSLPPALTRIVAICMIVTAIALVGVVYTAYAALSESADASEEISLEKNNDTKEGEAATDVPQTLHVHVVGEVGAPGMVEVGADARVADAITAAGGFTPLADEQSINLARHVSDGEQIVVAGKGDAVSGMNPASGDTTGIQTLPQSGAHTGKVNLNTATETELQTLKGIGAAKAQKIIAYRKEHGPFKSIEELTKVDGIGDKTLRSLKESITV